MSAPPWIPLYIGDYLKDTQHLTVEEHGAYFLLLMYCWCHGGFIPLNERSTSVITKMSALQWEKSREVLLGFFEKTDYGYKQKRLSMELERSNYLINQRVEAGKSSAKARNERSTSVQRAFNERSTSVQRAFNERSTSVQRAFNERSTSVQRALTQSQSQSQSQSKATDSSTTEKRSRTISLAHARSFSDHDCELIYQAYPKKVGRGDALRKIAGALKKISEDHPTDAIIWLLERTKEYSVIVRDKNPQFIPHPSTWYFQERYNDDFEILRKEEKRHGQSDSKQEQIERKLRESSKRFLEATQQPDERSGEDFST